MTIQGMTIDRFDVIVYWGIASPGVDLGKIVLTLPFKITSPYIAYQITLYI